MEGRAPGAVFDTNVLVSAVLAQTAGRTGAAPLRCVDAALGGRVRLFHGPSLLEELHDVLLRPKIGLSRERAAAYTRFFAGLGKIVGTPGELRVLQRDPDDNHVLEVAMLARADFLVTGNLRDYEELRSPEAEVIVFGGVKIVSPGEFLRALEQ